MTAPPWGKFNYEAWFNSPDVQMMHWKERMVYGDLLKFHWVRGHIPSDVSQAARMVGVLGDVELAEFADLFAAVVHKFKTVDNDPTRLISTRQDKERRKAISAWEQKRRAGKASGKSRSDNDNATDVPTVVQASVPTIAPTDIDVDLDVEVKEYVLSERAAPDVDNLFQRLGPHARKLNPKRDEQNRWIAWAKLQDVSLDTLESWMGGLALLRDKRGLEWIDPDEPVTCKVYEKFPILRSQAEGAWAKWGPGSVGEHRHDMQRLQA